MGSDEMQKQKIMRVVYNWGDQVKVGQGKLLFFTKDNQLLPLFEDETGNYEIEGTVLYDHAYGIKKGKVFPSFKLMEL